MQVEFSTISVSLPRKSHRFEKRSILGDTLSRLTAITNGLRPAMAVEIPITSICPSMSCIRSQDCGPVIRSWTILTAAAAPEIAHIHDHMPVILPKSNYAEWLEPATDVDAAQTLLLDNRGSLSAAALVVTSIAARRQETFWSSQFYKNHNLADG